MKPNWAYQLESSDFPKQSLVDFWRSFSVSTNMVLSSFLTPFIIHRVP
jgi:hypothetical protein